MAELQELMDAIQRQEADAVRALLRERPELARARTETGRTPVLWACYFGGGECLQALLELAREDLDACEAAATGATERLRALVGQDPEGVRRIGADGASPLHFAAFVGQEQCVGILLQAGADVNLLSTNENRNTPLHAALAGRGSMAIVEALIEAGADVNAVGALGTTPLHVAAARGSAEMIELLARHGARAVPMQDGKRPIAFARERGRAEAVAALDRLGLQ